MDIVEALRARAERRTLSAVDYSGDIKIDIAAADEIEKLRDALRNIDASDWENGICAGLARAALGEQK